MPSRSRISFAVLPSELSARYILPIRFPRSNYFVDRKKNCWSFFPNLEFFLTFLPIKDIALSVKQLLSRVHAQEFFSFINMAFLLQH